MLLPVRRALGPARALAHGPARRGAQRGRRRGRSGRRDCFCGDGDVHHRAHHGGHAGRRGVGHCPHHDYDLLVCLPLGELASEEALGDQGVREEGEEARQAGLPPGREALAPHARQDDGGGPRGGCGPRATGGAGTRGGRAEARGGAARARRGGGGGGRARDAGPPHGGEVGAHATRQARSGRRLHCLPWLQPPRPRLLSREAAHRRAYQASKGRRGASRDAAHDGAPCGGDGAQHGARVCGVPLAHDSRLGRAHSRDLDEGGRAHRARPALGARGAARCRGGHQPPGHSRRFAAEEHQRHRCAQEDTRRDGHAAS
mmetsp:Transcript_29798/g.77076  ORF Transcript_29798/g.77076 Transcript_29798/m.77076 type:complete len:316 (-) Transcript_29798:1075-2022(-)